MLNACRCLFIYGISACATGVLATQADEVLPDEGSVFSGHVRSLVMRSTTLAAPAEYYTLNTNRLRLQWKGQLTPSLAMEVQHDNQLSTGNAAASAPPPQHRVHRAHLTWSSGAIDLRVGRQRIAWGTGRFWSPLDLLNPLSPASLEPGERQGVDAALLEYRSSALAALSLVHATVRGHGRNNTLVRWRANAGGLDYAVTGGQVTAGRLAGLELEGQWGGAGWRAEWTVSQPVAASRYTRMMLGWDYAFTKSLTVSAEWYRDGSGQSDTKRYDVAGLLAERRLTLGRHYLGLYANYEFTPLLRWTNWLAINLDDRSRYFSPRLTWSINKDADLSAGLLYFAGRTGSEFTLRRNVVFAQAQWYF